MVESAKIGVSDSGADAAEDLGMVPMWMMPLARRCSCAALLCLLAGVPIAAIAAPVTSSDDADGSDSLRDPLQSSGGPLAAQTSTARGLERPIGVETSTGNKNLDLLLELQDKPSEALRQAAPRSAAAASAAASALAELRRKAAERPAQNDSKQHDNQPKAAPPPFEGMSTLEGEARAAQPTERRQWSGQFAGGGGGGGAGNSDGSRESGSSRGGYDEDNLLRRLPRELIAFLRDNRYWLMGALGGLVVVGAAIKAYSRRI